jgi:hypothetical protein
MRTSVPQLPTSKIWTQTLSPTQKSRKRHIETFTKFGVSSLFENGDAIDPREYEGLRMKGCDCCIVHVE